MTKEIAMKRLLVLAAMASFALPTFAGQEQKTEPTIVADSGWGSVKVGATSDQITAALGKGKVCAEYKDVYFVDYAKMGIQVSFLTKDNKVNAIFFYNKQKGDENFAAFRGKTATGIGWGSSVDDVTKAYGKPIHDYSGQRDGMAWRRVVFHGIDFRFENDKMVRIAIRAD
jgi:hypothetical protein